MSRFAKVGHQESMTNHRSSVRRTVAAFQAIPSHPAGPALLLATLGIGVSLISGSCTSSDPIFRAGEGGAAGFNLGGDTGSAGREAGEGGQTGVGGANVGIGGQAGEPDGQVGGQAGFNNGGQPGFNTGGQAGFNTGGQAGFNTGGAPGGGNCDLVVTLTECEARPDCYSVFFDPGNCGCASSGCCAHFHHCADGYAAPCAGQVSCAVSAPHCESPYLVSFRSGCYEGCVHNKDCAP